MSMASVSSCSCSHPVNCNHDCHGRHCDPTEHVCSIEFLPDDGGLARWGCIECTPGQGLPHAADCASQGVVAPIEMPEPDSVRPQSV